MRRYEYKVIDTGKHVQEHLNELGAAGWRVVCVTTKKQLFIAPPQAIILMREVRSTETPKISDESDREGRTALLVG